MIDEVVPVSANFVPKAFNSGDVSHVHRQCFYTPGTTIDLSEKEWNKPLCLISIFSVDFTKFGLQYALL